LACPRFRAVMSKKIFRMSLTGSQPLEYMFWGEVRQDESGAVMRQAFRIRDANTVLNRYEIGWTKDDNANVETFASRKADALDWAAGESVSRHGYTYYVFDRMARRGCACRWDFRSGALVEVTNR